MEKRNQLDVRIVLLPGGPPRALVEPVPFSDSTILLSDRGKSARFTVLVNGRSNPVDLGVAADLFMKDDR